MKKDLCTIRKFITVLAAVTMLLATVLFMQVSVNANAETVNVTQNEEIYRELTNNDQLFGLDFCCFVNRFLRDFKKFSK